MSGPVDRTDGHVDPVGLGVTKTDVSHWIDISLTGRYSQMN